MRRQTILPSLLASNFESVKTNALTIIQKLDKHNEWVRNDLISQFGSEKIISIGKQYENASTLAGFIAENENTFSGVLLYSISGNECELVYVHAIKPGNGVGKNLIAKLIETVKNKAIERLWVITTNDNLEALAFYQKQEFNLVKVYPNAMEKVRKIKPFVPMTGKNDIPLRDMIELEMKFKKSP